MGLIDLLHRQLVFFPDRAVNRTPADVGLDFAEVHFSAADGVRLHGWFIPAPAAAQSEPAAGQSAHPEPAAGQSAHPEPAAGQTAHPEPAAGQTAHPELPHPAHPEPAAGHPSHPVPAAGQSAHPELTHPAHPELVEVPAHPELTHPAHPELVEVPAHPEPAAGQSAHPEPAAGQSAHPEPAAGQSAHPELTHPSHPVPTAGQSAHPELTHPAHPELVEGPAHPELTHPAHPELVEVPAHPELVAGQTNLTILWFHGNAGNLGYQVDDLLALRQWTAANIFIFDYRGYGNSAGRPSERGFYRDARAAWGYLLTRPDIDPQRIILYGRSLGTAAAVELAAHPPAGPPPYAVILYSPLTSLGDMARAVHTRLPLHWLAGGQFNSLARIGRVSAPLLIIHSAEDEIIPVAQGRRLFAAAPEPKHFLYPDAAGHNDALDLSDAALAAGLADFLKTLPAD